jgi:hypothetical protein
MIKKLLLVTAIFLGIQAKTQAQAGAALKFDGANDLVVSSPHSVLTEYTVEAWIKLNNLNNQNIITATDNLGTSTSASHQIKLVSGKFEHYLYDGSARTLTSTITVTTGTWYHVAISAKNNGKMKITVNSNETVSAFNIGTIWQNLNKFHLGGNAIGVGYFNGELDEVRIWNRQLCLEEIINNKDGEIATTAPGLVTNYHFNQGVAGGNNTMVVSALDVSGFSRNGTLTNFALTGTASNWVAPGAVTSGAAVTSFVLPNVTINPSTTLTCAGSVVTFTAIGGAFSYVWNNGSTASTYSQTAFTGSMSASVTGSDVNGCYGPAAVVVVSVSAAPVLSNDLGYFCSGTDYTISPTVISGGPITSYTYSTGSSIISPTSTVTYTVSGTNAAGCVSANATGTVEVCGASGKALNMNGTDDVLNTGILYSDFTNSWTLECWAKSPTIPNTTEHNGPMYGVNMGIVWDHLSNTFKSSATVQAASNAFYAASFGTLLANTWYHLAATYDGTVLRAYKNGVLMNSVTTTGGLAAATGGFTFGRHPSLSQFWNGTMDEARVWTVARTCAEINQNMNIELTGSQTGLKAYYKFNEGTPAANNISIISTLDASGNNYNCSLAGFTRTGSTSNYLVGAPFNNTLNPLCLTTGVNEINTTNTFIIYPNPSSSILNIEVKEQAQISITNVLGDVVLTQTINGLSKIDVSNLTSGVYFIQDSKSGKAVKFIKE